MLRFKQFLIEDGLANRSNYAFSDLARSQRKNSNFWTSLYDPKQAASMSPEQKKFLEDLTGPLEHSQTKLSSYTGSRSVQAKLEELRKLQAERLEEIARWTSPIGGSGNNMWTPRKPEPINMVDKIEELIKNLESSKNSIQAGDSLFTRVTDKPMTVYRRISVDPFNDSEPTRKWGQKVLDMISKGEVLRDTNLLSTTTHKGMATGWGFRPENKFSKILQIEVPAGTKYFVNPLSKAGPVDPKLGLTPPGYDPRDVKLGIDPKTPYGFAEDEILFPRETGLHIDPNGSDLNLHNVGEQKTQTVKTHRARMVSPEPGTPDRLMDEINSQLEHLKQELEKERALLNPKSNSIASEIKPISSIENSVAKAANAESIGSRMVSKGKDVVNTIQNLETGLTKPGIARAAEMVGVSKGVAGKLPFIGAALSIPDAINRFKEGDVIGSVGSVAQNFDPTMLTSVAMSAHDKYEQGAKEATTKARSAQGPKDFSKTWDILDPILPSELKGAGSNVRTVIDANTVTPAQAQLSNVIVRGSIGPNPTQTVKQENKPQKLSTDDVSTDEEKRKFEQEQGLDFKTRKSEHSSIPVRKMETPGFLQSLFGMTPRVPS